MRASVVIVAVAVIPGRRNSSVLSTESTASYETTPSSDFGSFRSESSFEGKVFPA